MLRMPWKKKKSSREWQQEDDRKFQGKSIQKGELEHVGIAGKKKEGTNT